MARGRRGFAASDVWPALSDTMLAFLLVLLILLVFQVGKNVEIVSDRALLMHKQMVEDQEKVERAVKSLQQRYHGIEISEPDGNAQEIILGSEVLFNMGSADLSREGEMLLDELVRRVVQQEIQTLKEITVQGHTDNVQINTIRFPSNWELSTARASRVVRTLINSSPDQRGIDPRDVTLVAAGYGEYEPIDTVDIGRNRRIELRLVYTNIF